MCIAVFLWKSHPLYPFLLLLNRDEFYSRPTTPLGWWEDGEILGGRDGQAGGTWLACTKHGKLAFLTNVREIRSESEVKSRGEIPIRFLKGTKNPKEFAEELKGEANEFHGFNLIVADLRSMAMVYVTNRPKGGLYITEVSSGVHVLSNTQLDAAWPKGRYGTRSTSGLLLGTTGQVSFYEAYVENDEWREQTTSFHIEKDEV